MSRNRLFNVLIAILLATVVALTAREAAATAGVIGQENSASRSSVACASLPSCSSIRSEYVAERDAWLTYTEDRPTGIDGGLIDLLSKYRTCAR